MKKSIQWRLALIALSVAIALFLFVPSTPLSAGLPDWWRQSVPKISLGLDLRGGSHLVMEVDTAKAVESSVDNIAADLQTTAASQTLAVTFSRTGQDITAKVRRFARREGREAREGQLCHHRDKEPGQGRAGVCHESGRGQAAQGVGRDPGARAHPPQGGQVRCCRACHLQAGERSDRAPASGREEPAGGDRVHQDRGQAGVQAPEHDG